MGRYWLEKHRSEETKEKLRLVMLGRKLSEETKLKIKQNNVKYWKGKKRDEKTSEILRTSRINKAPWNKGKTGIYSEETRINMGKGKLGKRSPMKNKTYEEIYGFEKAKEMKVRMSKRQSGRISPTKNRTYEESYGKERANQIKEKIRLANMGKKLSQEHKDKISRKLKGKKGKTHSLETRRKMGLSMKGRIPWNKGKKTLRASVEKMRRKLIGRKLSLETVFKMKLHPNSGCFKKGHKPTPEMVRKMLNPSKPSKIELKFQDIVKKHNLPYKFVGDGKFLIENKNPDFINTNGQKIAIEVFHKKHKCLFTNEGILKEPDYSRLDNYKKERKDIFGKYGWKVLFFDETQINEENVLNKLGGDF